MGNARNNLIVNSVKVSKENIAETRKKISALLQLQQKQLDIIFSGKPIRIFKDIDYKVAQRYHDAIEKIGLECQIEASTKQQENTVVPPHASTSSLTSFSLEEKVTTQMQNNYFCPACQVQQVNKNECEHCNCDLDVYRAKMKEKGFIEKDGAGYFKNRRMIHRRTDRIRRETLRMGENSDRRMREERRKEFGAYQFSF